MTNELKATPEEVVAEQGESHPSLTLKPRARGYGIGGAYEKPYLSGRNKPNQRRGSYGPLPHSGYYGAGAGDTRFQRGQAGFSEELKWYGPQYGEQTMGGGDAKKRR